MAKEEKAQIIIVKRRKKGGAGHHGGAWKVAYADFVTAMMAFFLVMWLVSSISKEQRAAVFDYFKNPSMQPGKTVQPAPGQMGPGGASTSVINMGGGLDAPRVTVVRNPDSNAKSIPQPFKVEMEQAHKLDSEQTHKLDSEQTHKLDSEQTRTVDSEQARKMDLEEARKITDEADKKKLESLLQELRQAIDKSQALRPFKDQLLLDITPEGLRIQIVDAQNRPMFDVGSARLKDYTTTILKILAGYLNTVPNRISISGHTDVRTYPGGVGYTNWELSADRANAARRALGSGGLNEAKISRVVGLSSSVLFDKDDPYNAINRRISIIVMTKQAEDTALKTDSRPQGRSDPPAQPSPPPPAATTRIEAAPQKTVPAAAPRAAATIEASPEKAIDTAAPELFPPGPPPAKPPAAGPPVAADDGAPGL
jgi:chemotaxis protein MotB